MPDLNDMLENVQGQSKDITQKLETLLGTYENLYREGHRQYVQERTGSEEGLGEFSHLVRIVRRNRDVIGSVLRGMKNLRSISEFRFIEEEVSEAEEKKVDVGAVAAIRVPESEKGGTNG